MVLQKRLDYGFNGYQVPPAPRAPRSARRRGTVRKRVQEDQICAFDLLATVAGDILLKKEGSSSSCNASSEKDQSAILEQDCPEGNIALKMEVCDHESCDRKYFVSELVSPCAEEKLCSKESFTPQDEKAPCDDDSSGSASVLTTSNCSESLAFDKLSNCKIMDDMGSVCKVELGSSEYMASVNCKLDKEGKTLVKPDSQSSEEVLIGTEVDMCSSEDPVVWNVEPLALVKSHSSAKVPMCGDITPHRPFPVNQDDVKLVSRDDDENSSGCTHPSTAFKYSKPMPRNGDRRIRKILASKCWKVATKLKDETHLNPDKDVKPIYHNKKDCNKRPRSQMNIPFKKRELFEHSSFSKTDGCIKGKDYYESHKMGFGPASIACSKFLGTGGSCSLAGQNTSFQSKDSHVKLQIKSFRVPELFIEIPETATVASLKRMVMEAVTKILGGGLHVGVRVQGKKVRDDNKTLLQTGISNENQLGSLGFSLEPNPSKSSSFLYPVDSPHLFAGGASQHLTRHQSNPSMVHQGTSDNLKEPHIANLESFVESDHDSAPSPINTSVEKNTTESKAIVPMQAMNVDALAMVPAHHKSKRSEIAQRRIRRPFSVSEVEALVQAVERLGTGRWRDVKLRAFDNAKHRTYVDLKDKWKTLVHTARISPQQRRGEPVPQELLDRVLNAHAYWSKQQAKQQPDTCLSSEMCLE